MRLFVTLLTFSLSLTACTKSDSISPDTLTGAWIERSSRQDTLIFNLDRSGKPLPKTILVNRGKERNASGALLPKIGSGLYSYEIRQDRIYVQSLLSSSSIGTEYAIEQRGSELRISNFFELGFNQPATATRTLVRFP